MKINRVIATLLLLTMMLSLAVGCSKKKEEVELDRGQAIAEFLEIDIDKVELCTTAKVNRYEYVCFYYEGLTKEESGYSYAAFRKKATGEYVMEFAQLPGKLLPMAEGIRSGYFDDHLIIVSSNEDLGMIRFNGEIAQEVIVEGAPFIYAVNIFQGSDTAKPVDCTFYDKDGNQIQ